MPFATPEAIQHLRGQHGYDAAPHITCMGGSREEIRGLLKLYRALGARRLVTLRARVDNATNRNYWASVGGYPGAGYLVVGAPRTFSLSASVDF